MTVFDFLHCANKNDIANFIYLLVSGCECYGDCPLKKIAFFTKTYYGCTKETILKWIDNDITDIGVIKNEND